MAIDSERERRIIDMMESAGMQRDEAEFAVAIELGELDGDVIEVDDDATTTGNQ